MRRRYKYPLLAIVGAWGLVLAVILIRMMAREYVEGREVLYDVSDYSNGLVSQQYDQAYRYAGEGFRAALPYDKFVTLYRGLQKQYGTLKAVTPQGYEIHGSGNLMMWRAVVERDFVYEKKTLRFEFVLHKESGHWVIFSAEEL
jgi:hypothetical protein